MRMTPRLAGLPRFGFLYGLILLLIVIPMVLICALGLGVWPWWHSVGLEVRTTPPAFLVADAFDDPVIVTVQSAEGSMVASESRLRLNLRPVWWDGLRDVLRARLSRSPHRVVYVEGDDLLEFGNIVRVIDIARDAWSGVPVVLLTPALKRPLIGKSEGLMVDRGTKPSSAARHVSECPKIPANVRGGRPLEQSSQCSMNRLSSFFSFELSCQRVPLRRRLGGRGSRPEISCTKTF